MSERNPIRTAEWPAGCQRPATCEQRRECSYHLTAMDFAAELVGVFVTNPCPHRNTIGIWEETHV